MGRIRFLVYEHDGEGVGGLCTRPGEHEGEQNENVHSSKQFKTQRVTVKFSVRAQ
jgi:hypothetical protein